MKRDCILTLTLLALLVWFGCAPSYGQAPVVTRQPRIHEQFVSARVVALTDAGANKDLERKTGIQSRRQLVELVILEGDLAGKRCSLVNEITDNPAYNIDLRPGREVILSIVTADGASPEINIADYHRAPVLAWLFAAFLAVFLFFGGRKGLKSLVGLLLCVALIAFVLLPLSMKGINPLLTAMAICLVATAATVGLVAGNSRKAAAAALGTAGGVVAAGVASQLVIACAPLTGLSSEESQILRGSILSLPPAFYSGLLAAGMLIGALGVIMDVGISIASAVCELQLRNGSLTVKQLYQSGMNVGRDIMGTMTATLVLAYAGSALPLLLVLSQVPTIKLLNLDLVATEIAAALTGSLGLTLTVPLTALASAKLLGARPERRELAPMHESKWEKESERVFK